MIYGHVDDLRVVGDPVHDRSGLTLVSVVRDELYFLPAFLDHYRRLGVTRFIVLDDRSADGTRAYLAAQPDVMVLESPGYRYGDRVFPGRVLPPFSDINMHPAWRTLMLERYCAGDWALLADADEFIALAPGTTLSDVISKAEREGVRGVGGVMLDVYPADIEAMRQPGPFDPAATWYFDAVPHLELQPDALPATLYPGARARLHSVFALGEPAWRRQLRRWRFGRPYNPLNMIPKMALLRWNETDFCIDTHWPDVPASTRLLIPILHYKFTHDTWRRMAYARASKAYFCNSREYDGLSALLDGMAAAGAGFRAAASRLASDSGALAASGNARF